MQNRQKPETTTIFWVIAIIFIVAAFSTIGRVLKFGEETNPFIYELFAGILGSVITVAAMTIMVRMQSAKEKEREFAARLFDKKIAVYGDLLDAIFTIDDDNIITRLETLNIEKKIGNACLVAGEELVSTMSQFIYQLKVYGVLYSRSMATDQIEHFTNFVRDERKKSNPHHSYLSLEKTLLELDVRENLDAYFVSLDDVVQQIREDLNVVDGDVREEVEHFVRTPYNVYDMIKRPNLVDEGLVMNGNGIVRDHELVG